jgi:hypothetical protein
LAHTVGALAGVALSVAALASSTVALAAPLRETSASRPIDPLIALSAYGTVQSRNAVCAAAARLRARPSPEQTQQCNLTALSLARMPSKGKSPVGPHTAEAPSAPSTISNGLDDLVAALNRLTEVAAAVLSRRGQTKLPIGPD